jgi:hypothetical protein
MPGTVRVHRTCATEFEMVGWLDRLQRKSRVAGFLIAVVYKYVDDQGSYLAALITYMLAVTVTKRPTVTYRSGWMATAPPKVICGRSEK